MAERRHTVDATFDLAPVGMLHLDRQGLPIRVNAEFCDMLGHSSRELIGRPLGAIVHPEDSARCVDGVKRLAAGRTASFVLEQRMRRHDGTWLSTQMNLTLVPGYDGAADYILAVLTDISRQKRAEEAARQTTERLELVVNNAPVVLWAIDRQGMFTISRGAGLTPLRLSTGDFIGRSIFDMFGAFPTICDSARRALGGETFSYLAELDEITYETFLTPMRDAAGEIIGAIGVSTDVTARQNFADALARRADFERLLSGISTRFINLDLTEVDSGIVSALREIGEFCNADRVNVFQIRDDGKTADATHEWAKPPRPRIAPRYQGWRLEEEVPWFAEAISRQEAVHIPRIADMPRKASTERKRLEGRGVMSLLVVPMAARGKLVGFVGFENDEEEQTWSDDAILLLTIFGEILANTLEYQRNRIALWRAHEQLESRVSERTAELSAANITLRQQIAERRRIEADLRGQQQLMEQLLSAHERDRQLVAYEIHDAIVQDIAAALMHFEAYHDQCPGASAAQNAMIERGLALLRGTIGEARRLISGLRPPIIDEMGVVAAIEYLIGEQPREGNTRVEFRHEVRFDRLAPLLEGGIFRIVQEALTNVQRHSHADRAQVRLWHVDNRVYIEIRDWGVGFNPAEVTEHRFGLRGIRERAKLLHGQAEVESAPGKGTCITVELPISLAISFAE